MKKLRRLWYGLPAAAMMAIPSCAAISAERMRAEDRVEGFEMAAWNFACEATRADCTRLKRPVVGYSFLPNGILGLYPHLGGWIVIVNIKLADNPLSVPVITHEMIHYIQHYTDFQGSSCARERQAFDLVVEMNKKYLLDPFGMIVVPWREIAHQYRCPINA
jgi:hypothetical protein